MHLHVLFLFSYESQWMKLDFSTFLFSKNKSVEQVNLLHPSSKQCNLNVFSGIIYMQTPVFPLSASFSLSLPASIHSALFSKLVMINI